MSAWFYRGSTADRRRFWYWAFTGETHRHHGITWRYAGERCAGLKWKWRNAR